MRHILLASLCLVSPAWSRHVARRPDGTEYSAATMERVWRVLAEFPVIDGHNDFPMAIRDLFHNDIDAVNFDHDLTQVLFVLSQILKLEDKWDKNFKLQTLLHFSYISCTYAFDYDIILNK